MSDGPMLNAYPDSIGGTLGDIVSVLKKPEFKDVFESFYILPSIYHSDLDRGFSVIDYDINESMADKGDLDGIKSLGINLKLDFILNHLSVLSAQFQDIIENGEASQYKDFFINWNKFWEGCGEMSGQGYIIPREELIKDMFFRKPGLPILMVRFPDGTEVPYWNTFYQEIQYKHIATQELIQETGIGTSDAKQLAGLINKQLEEGGKPGSLSFGEYEEYKVVVEGMLESGRSYLGQMDLNIKSPLVWEHYKETLKKLAGYGAKIVRLDAFAYAPKEPGSKNFLNEPGTWELLEKVKELADQYNIQLLPEIHASYGEKIYETLAGKGYMSYDFFLPGLVIYAVEHKNGDVLARWAAELSSKKIRTVNMLGCHDGIPLLDLKGFLPDADIEEIIDIITNRGGYVKNLHGQKNMYYQVNATYYSALGEDNQKMLFARALQIFMPGKPQVWYLDLFAGKNDYKAVEMAGPGGHKEINRTNITKEQAEEALKQDIVKKQLELLHFRNTCQAFGFDAELEIKGNGSYLEFQWRKGGAEAVLKADFATYQYEITSK
ncbi:MAG: glycosidase [Lachnospiraceae bacterium]|nr:glycosidase [Lachnospiraceae bacterium]